LLHHAPPFLDFRVHDGHDGVVHREGDKAMQEQTRWKRRPEGSTWGDFGPDDQCGRMNLLTPEKVLQGMREVREGITFNLSLPLDFPGGNVLNPRRLPPVLRPTLRNGKSNMNYQLRCDNAACTDVISDDLVVMHLQYSTQWDSLAHVGSVFDAQGPASRRRSTTTASARASTWSAPTPPRGRASSTSPRCRASRPPARRSWGSRTCRSAACRDAP
jgi:hypothetical protein